MDHILRSKGLRQEIHDLLQDAPTHLHWESLLLSGGTVEMFLLGLTM